MSADQVSIHKFVFVAIQLNYFSGKKCQLNYRGGDKCWSNEKNL